MADGLKRLSNMVKGGFDKWLDEHTDPDCRLRTGH